MNWFERYGIPGAYFIGLMAGWVYAFYPNLLNHHTWPDSQWLLGLAAITLLPIGYVISVFSQVVYLNWRRCFARWSSLRGLLGFHGTATDRFRVPDSKLSQDEKDEAIIEARTLLLTASRNGPLTVVTHRYIRDWIARRMDVVAINQSVIWATVFAIIIAFFVFRWFPSSIAQAIPLVISFIVIIVMTCSVWVLRRQVVEVIAGIYRTYRSDDC